VSGRLFAEGPEGATISALYDPATYPGAPGESCRACTGSGHRHSRIAGRWYLIECSVCEGGGTVTSVSIGRAAA